jgi:hypothetical protein
VIVTGLVTQPNRWDGFGCDDSATSVASLVTAAS